MGLIHWLLEKMTERAMTTAGVLFVTRLEAEAALEEAECQNVLEQRAQQLEAEGKTHLAAALRAKAARITTDAPGELAIHALEHLHRTDTASSRLLSAQGQDIASAPGKTARAASTAKQPIRRLPQQSAPSAPAAES
jgi:hypothetical protein